MCLYMWHLTSCSTVQAVRFSEYDHISLTYSCTPVVKVSHHPAKESYGSMTVDYVVMSLLSAVQ